MGNAESYLNFPCVQSVYNKVFETISPTQLYYKGEKYYINLTSDIEKTKCEYCDCKGGFRIIVDKGIQFRIADIEKEPFVWHFGLGGQKYIFIELLNDIDFSNIIMYGDHKDIFIFSEDNQIVNYIRNNKLILTNMKCHLSAYCGIFKFHSKMTPLFYNKNELRLLHDFNSSDNYLIKRSIVSNRKSLSSKICGKSVQNCIYETLCNIIITYRSDEDMFDIKDITEHEINELCKLDEKQTYYNRTSFMAIIKPGIKFKVFDITWEINKDTKNKKYRLCAEMIKPISLNDVLVFGDYNNIGNISENNLLLKFLDDNIINFEWVIFNIPLDDCTMFKFEGLCKPIKFNNQLLKFN